MAKINTGVFGELSGKLGKVSFRRTRYGGQIIQQAHPRDPETPAQMAQRHRMAQAGRAWRGMTLEQAAAWSAYCGDDRGEVPVQVFVRLAVRFLQVNPNGEIPLMPPSAPFPGDGVRLGLDGGSGVVRLEVLYGNSPGVVTEVLFQPLASIHRATYSEKYRSQGFFSCVAGEAIELPTRRGVVAVAIRVVEAATGQAGGLLELGRVVVG